MPPGVAGSEELLQVKRQGIGIEKFGAGKDDGSVFFVRNYGIDFHRKYVAKVLKRFQRLRKPNEFVETYFDMVTVLRIIHQPGGRI